MNQDHDVLSPVKRLLYLNKNIYTYHTEFDNTWFDRVQLLENTHVPTKSHKESRGILTYLCSPLYSTDCSDVINPCDPYLWQNFPVFWYKFAVLIYFVVPVTIEVQQRLLFVV